MSEIPKDVLAAAIQSLMVEDHELVGSISAAILAERKRCADQILAYRESVEDSEDLQVLERLIREGGIEP